MASHVMIIENKEADPGKPRYVSVYMEDPIWGANTWEIDTPDTWIGTGKGEYRVVGFNFDGIQFRDGSWDDGQTRMSFSSIKYPKDCEPKPGEAYKTGQGLYRIPNRWSGNGFMLEWSGRNIAPEP